MERICVEPSPATKQRIIVILEHLEAVVGELEQMIRTGGHLRVVAQDQASEPSLGKRCAAARRAAPRAEAR